MHWYWKSKILEDVMHFVEDCLYKLGVQVYKSERLSRFFENWH